MFDMFWNSVLLFCNGKLFQDPSKVMMLAGLGVGVGAVLFVVFVKIGLALWFSVALASLFVGALQPRLFRDLKYR
ncbi:MAG: hypothetical protein KC592_09335 [Nitrospira sp.]|nr:hypothetical protein [Nitrospira sp.]HBP88561.1 hypothetical protein [Nitrospiraceae bacterium]HNP30670.1 hypothetical protein [Nitrospirales bacterium]